MVDTNGPTNINKMQILSDNNLTSVSTINQNKANTQQENQVEGQTIEQGKNDEIELDLITEWNSWKCLKCGYVYEGHQLKLKCPRCANEDTRLFQDLD